ncbi:MAG: hypothetical protein FWE86_01725, partial [Oscillospiraceae bacterium]|nr:hypothetical protein [Oscillospiraceae bacterium]
MWQNNSALPFSVAAPRIMSRMARGDVRRAIQTAVGGEGRRAWPIIIPQMILATLFLGVMRELLLPGNPEPMGSASADSFLRCFLLLA